MVNSSPALMAVVLALLILALFPQPVSADSIRIRALLDDEGNVVIQREYTGRGWVTVTAITLGEAEDGEVFQHGSTSLAVEFIPWARMPHPKDGRITTRPVPGRTICSEGTPVAWDEDGNPNRWTHECESHMHHVLSASCAWGWNAELGPFTSLAEALEVGGYALLICRHGGVLQGLPGGGQSLNTLKANVTATLAASGETRPLEAVPEVATRDNPVRSETTYVDIRVLKVAGSNEAPTISVQARGGGALQALPLERPITVGIFSIVP